MEKRDELGDHVGCGGECVDLLIWNVGEVAAEELADACPVVLERAGAAVGQVDQDHAPVVSCRSRRTSPCCSSALTRLVIVG